MVTLYGSASMVKPRRSLAGVVVPDEPAEALVIAGDLLTIGLF